MLVPGRYVGSRTDLRLVNRENFGWRELEEEMTLQHVTTETMLKEAAQVQNFCHPQYRSALYRLPTIDRDSERRSSPPVRA